MNGAAVMALCALIGAAGSSGADPVPAQAIEPGMRFSLQVGAAVRALQGGLRIEFEGVSADSRCPKGEQCVWAGDATLRVWLQSGAGPRELRELHTAAGARSTLQLPGHELRLLGLAPDAITGKTIARQDYVATLLLSRSASEAPER